MEYYAKSRQKILTQGEIDKVKNELEDLIMNLEGEFTETDLKIIRNNIGSITNFVGFPIPLVALSAHIE